MLLVLSAFYVAIIAGYAERVHFIDQCLPAKSQNARGLCNVAAGCFQGLHDLFFFHFSHGL